MAVFVQLDAQGDASAVVVACTKLWNDARERGFRVFMEDPAAVAAGNGRFGIELPDATDAADARAVITSMIDQIPGASDLLTFVEEASDAA